MLDTCTVSDGQIRQKGRVVSEVAALMDHGLRLLEFVWCHVACGKKRMQVTRSTSPTDVPAAEPENQTGRWSDDEWANTV